MAINLAWDGQEAEAGLNKTAHLLKSTGIAALDAANNFSKLMQDKVKSLGLSDSEIRSLSRLSELDKERAIAKYEEDAAFRKMGKNAQLLYEQMTAQAEEAAKAEAQLKAQQESRAKMLAGLSALDKQRLFDKEARQQKILGMTAKQQLAFEAQEKAAEKARARAEQWADMSWIKKIKESLKGAQDIKATIELVRGLFRLLAAGPMAAGRSGGQILGLSAELETTKIKMGVLLGTFAKGADQIDRLRRVSVDLGVPLQDVADSFRTLFTAGIGAGDSEQLIKTFGKIAPLLGQGGLGQLSQGIAGMARSGMAEKSALDQLASTGLPVYDALADRLTTITGELHTVQMAQQSVEQGAVLASTAIGAMQEAARSPQALEAAQKFGESLDGQLLRLREGVIDIFRDVGDLIRSEIPVDNLLAGIRGAISAIADVVKEMAKEFAKINGGGDDLEANFKNARGFMLDLMETVVKAMREVIEGFREVADTIKELKPGKVAGWFNPVGGGLGGMIQKEVRGLINGGKPLPQFGDDLLNIIEKMRAAAKAADNKLSPFTFGQLPANAGPQPQEMRAALDNFTELRKIKKIASQGGAWDIGSVQGTVGAFLEKFGPKPDAGINQRIEAGSAAAAEAVLRNNSRFGEVSIGEAIKRAVEEAEKQSKLQTDIEQKMLDAIKNQKFPPTVQVPV